VSRARLGKAFCNLSLVSFCIYLLATMDLTLLYILFMFLIILFIVYFNYMLSIVKLSLYVSIRLYNAHLEVQWVSGRQRVSVVLIHCLPADAPYISGHVIDRADVTLPLSPL
jgi:hypothetical protein